MSTLNKLFARLLKDTTGNIELRRMVWNPEKGNTGRYDEPVDRLFSHDIKELVNFASNGDGDVFHGINLRRIESLTGRRKDISEVVCVTVDVDFKNTSQIDFESILDSFPHKPSVILNSGNGRHLYWFLKIPLIINSEAELERPEGISKGLAVIFKGDHTFNADRVLRTPGRINSKWVHKPMCEMITFIDTEYDLHDLKQYYVSTGRPATEKLNIGSISTELPTRFVALLDKNRTIKNTWDGMRSDLDDQSGSGFDMSMASILVLYRFSPEEIAAILKQMPSGKGLEASGSYLEHTISKAIASIENDCQRSVLADNSELGNMDSWPELKNLPESLLAVPVFDAFLIPDPFRGWLEDITDRMRCPIEFPTIGAIVALSSLVGRKIGIRPKQADDWLVIPNLWGAVIGRSGIMKSPALQEAIKPLARLESEAHQKYLKEVKEFDSNAEIIKLQQEESRNKMKRAIKRGEDPKTFNSLYVMPGEASPIAKRFIVNDPTVEKLGELLNQNPNGLFLFRDELSGWLQTLDRENRENDRAFYLESWNGANSYTYDRINRGTLFIEANCLSILGGITPGPLSEYLRSAIKGGTGADGLMQRFQLLVYPDDPGPWKNVDRSPDIKARERAFAIFQNINEIIFDGFGGSLIERDGNIPFLRFSPEAQECFDLWRGLLENKIRSGKEHPVLEAHLSKYRKLLPSLALLFHVMEIADGLSAGPVSRDAILRAFGWVEFLEAHARRIYQSVTQYKLLAARLLADKIKANQLPNPFTLRDVYHKGWSGLSEVNDVSSAVDLLEDSYWLRSQEIRTLGRPKTLYFINPRLKPSKAPKAA